MNFHADWCEPCHSLKPLLEKIAEENVGRLHLAEVRLFFILFLYYFGANCVADSLQLQFYFDSNHVPVRKRVNVKNAFIVTAQSE